jgi:hypothetical protein
MVTIARLVALVGIFIVSCVAWLVLGGVTWERSHDASDRLRGEVADLWGRPHEQAAPAFVFHWTETREVRRTEEVAGETRHVVSEVEEAKSSTHSAGSTDVEVDLKLDPRRKGLVWYALYDVGFDGRWTYTHDAGRSGDLELRFRLPDPSGVYDGFRFVVDGTDLTGDVQPVDGLLAARVPVTHGQTVTLEVGYRSRGQDRWSYRPARGVVRLDDFAVQMRTDFGSIDFPGESLSPSEKAQRADGGWDLAWRFERVVTGYSMGMEMPQRIQPGELAASLSWSAPISLFFFFLVMFVLAVLKRIDLHPMNFLLLAGAFFSFHLLFAYLVDHVAVEVAFAAASVTSVVLVVSYLRLVVSNQFAFREAAAAQLVYLVGFSMAHFWEGFTGLTVTVLSIGTLFLLMQATGRIRWSEVFVKRRSASGLSPEGMPAR